MKGKPIIDETDAKILRTLIKDARTRITTIAKSCGLSSTAIVNRIKNLKEMGVIAGSVVFWDLTTLDYLYPASLGISLASKQIPRVIELIEKQPNVIILSRSIGKHDLTVFLIAKNIKQVDDIKRAISAHAYIRKVTLNLWTTPHFNFSNVEIKPTER